MANVQTSVLIPTYNQRPAFLAACLRSIAWQDRGGEIEAIVIDDGSDTPIAPFVDKIVGGVERLTDVTFKHIRQENGGVASALNAGLEVATGKYIQWLPSDDLFVWDNCIQMRLLLERSDHGAGYCAYEEGIPQAGATWAATTYGSREQLFSDLKKHCFINAATMIWERDFLDLICLDSGEYFDPRMVHAQDYEIILRSAEQTNFAALNKPLVRRRIHAGQMINTLHDPEERSKKEADMAYLADRYGAHRGVWVPQETVGA